MFPIILVHGFPFDGSMWSRQVEFLRSPAGGGRKVVTPDMPGFGHPPKSPAPAKDKATIELFARELHAVIGEHGGRAIVGGMSMGGYILLALLREFPEDVAAAMFIDTRADDDSAEARRNRLNSIDDVQTHGTANLIETLTGKLLSKKSAKSTRQLVRAMMERQPADAVIAAQTAMARRRDQTDLLADLKIPALIVVGAEDVITPPSVALAMQSHMPHAMLAQIVSSGHMTPVEQPDAVNGAIKTFLATVKD